MPITASSSISYPGFAAFPATFVAQQHQQSGRWAHVLSRARIKPAPRISPGFSGDQDNR
jgi:hypothetical protein